MAKLLCALATLPQAWGALVLSSAFGSNMVLQRASNAAIWGWSSPNDSVNVTCTSTETRTVQADSTGLFVYYTEPTPAGGPYSFKFISATEGSVTLANVLFGDVWICSGQSNMCFDVSQAFNATEEVAAAGNPFYENMRLMTVGHGGSSTPQSNIVVEQPWSVANSQSVGAGGGNWSYFSATCWFSFKAAYDSLNGTVPLGLIVSAVSATPIQLWMAPDALAACPGYPVPSTYCNGEAGCLYNAMVHPFITPVPLALSGFVWYQGEQNIGNAENNPVTNSSSINEYYTCALNAHIQSWRKAFKQPSAFFGVVILAPWVVGGGNITALPRTRLAQVKAVATLSNTHLVPAYDLGDLGTPWPGHPRNKQTVGMRMAAGLLEMVYGQQATTRGPAYSSASVVQANETSLTVRVDFLPSSLAACSSPAPSLELNLSVACPAAQNATFPVDSCESFAIQTSDGQWHQASEAALSSDGLGLLLTISIPPALSSRPTAAAPLVPVATRGYYANWPQVQLYSGCGWPAEPWLQAMP